MDPPPQDLEKAVSPTSSPILQMGKLRYIKSTAERRLEPWFPQPGSDIFSYSAVQKTVRVGLK